MFKRAQRRIEKSKKEHKLGLTPEVKEELGFNDTDTDTDTDSDESASESGSESSGAESPSRKRKRPLEDDGDDSGDGGQGDSSGHASEDEEEGEADSAGGVEDEAGAESGPTVGDALGDPLFSVSGHQHACAVCPGRLLKNRHMAELHTAAVVRWTQFPLGCACVCVCADSTRSTTYAAMLVSSSPLCASRPGLGMFNQILRPTSCA